MYNVNSKENKWSQIITGHCGDIPIESAWLHYGCCCVCWCTIEETSGHQSEVSVFDYDLGDCWLC